MCALATFAEVYHVLLLLIVGPMAEAVFNDVIKKKGIAANFVVDSAGTSGYHIGENPDSR